MTADQPTDGNFVFRSSRLHLLHTRLRTELLIVFASLGCAVLVFIALKLHSV